MVLVQPNIRGPSIYCPKRDGVGERETGWAKLKTKPGLAAHGEGYGRIKSLKQNITGIKPSECKGQQSEG